MAVGLLLLRVVLGTLMAGHGAQKLFGRFGGPEDLKGAVVFLSSRASDYVTGHTLVVDGGQSA